jgi:AcrR family transcriptional regulator
MEREQRRAQILEVAKTVFAEKGYHEAKIDDIVAGAKVARGTFYLYFGDKRAIFGEIVDRFVGRITQVIYAIDPNDPTFTPLAQLTDNVRNVLELFTADPDMAKILFSDAVGLDPDFDRKLLAFYDQLSALIVRSLDYGVQVGLVRPGDNRMRSFCVLGVVKEFLYQVAMRRADFDRERAVATVIDIVAGGILTDAARAGAGANPLAASSS